jgi:hypothetical protein
MKTGIFTDIGNFLTTGGKPKIKKPTGLAQIYAGGRYYKSIIYPEFKNFIFKDKQEADNFINSLNIKK